MRLRRRRLGGRAGLAVALLVALVCALGGFEGLELKTHDLRFALRGPRESGAKVVVVGIDEATQDAWVQPTTFWGGHYAKLLTKARKAGAEWVGFDMILSADADGYLTALGGDDLAERAGQPDTTFARALVESAGHIGLAYKHDTRGNPVEPNARLWLADTEGKLLKGLGYVEFPPSSDDSVRQGTLYRRSGGEAADRVQPSLVAVAAAQMKGKSAFSARALGTLASGSGPSALDSDGDGLFWIDSIGRDVHEIPAVRLADGTLSSEDRAALRGAAVFVGQTFSGTADLHRTTMGLMRPGVHIHAQALATLLDGRPLRRGKLWAEAVFALVVGLVGVVAWARPRPALGGLLSLAAGAAYVGAAFYAFREWDVLLPLAGVGVALVAPPFAVGAARAVEERVERVRVEQVFGAQVGAGVRDFVLQPDWRQGQGGFTTVATVLFADLRGSTEMAKAQSPAQTVATLNAFFDTIVPCIEARGGIVLSFMGDGLIAVFGAPIRTEGHPADAVAAARGMVAAMDTLNARRALDGRPALRMGCGVHTGPLVCGNLGARERLQLTVVGDTVNVACRLEGACKGLGCRVAVSAATLRSVEPDPLAAGWSGPHRVALQGLDSPMVWILS